MISAWASKVQNGISFHSKRCPTAFRLAQSGVDIGVTDLVAMVPSVEA